MGESLMPAQPTAQPKCPDCQAAGLDNIVSAESKEKNGAGDAWFNIVYCQKCGHIYGIFSKYIITNASMPRMTLPF